RRLPYSFWVISMPWHGGPWSRIRPDTDPNMRPQMETKLTGWVTRATLLFGGNEVEVIELCPAHPSKATIKMKAAIATNSVAARKRLRGSRATANAKVAAMR